MLVDLINNFNLYAKEYPMVAGALSIWALGISTMIFKSIPMKALELIKKTFSTELTLISTGQAFHEFLKWYTDKGYTKNSRTLKISNGRWGGGESTKSLGYGTHYFFFEGSIIKAHMYKQESKGDREIDCVDLRVIGRSQRVYDRIFKDIRIEEDKRPERTIMHEYSPDGWVRVSEQRKRPIDTVHFNKGVKQKLLGFIKDFKEREEFNLKQGINHQTGILLYGPPGTGKTTMIKALASHLNCGIYYLKSTAGIERAFSSLPENALVVMEDIDSDTATHSREEKSKKQTTTGSLEDLFGGGGGIGSILNAIGGMTCSHGRVLVATTNHIDKLDPALIRNGRFDLKLEIDYADKYVVESFAQRLFNKELPSGFKVKDKLASSDIENYAVKNLDNFSKFISLVVDPSTDTIGETEVYPKKVVETLEV